MAAKNSVHSRPLSSKLGSGIKMAALACCLAEDEREALRRSRQIDRQLAQEKKNLRQEIKILLLGAGESGKSTFIKQMRIIHGEDYSENDRLEFRSLIFHNVLKGTKILVEARRRLQIPLANPENEANGYAVANYHRNGSLLPEEFHQYVAPLKALWADSGIQSTFRRSNEFQLVCVCVCSLCNVVYLARVYRPVYMHKDLFTLYICMGPE